VGTATSPNGTPSGPSTCGKGVSGVASANQEGEEGGEEGRKKMDKVVDDDAASVASAASVRSHRSWSNFLVVPGVPGSARASGCATTPLPAARPPATPTTHNFQGFRKDDDECDVDSEYEDNDLPKNVVEAERRRAAMEANLGNYCDVGAKETAGLSHMQMRALEAENREREEIRTREKKRKRGASGRKETYEE